VLRSLASDGRAATRGARSGARQRIPRANTRRVFPRLRREFLPCTSLQPHGALRMPASTS
jgi:hypothetical protein